MKLNSSDETLLIAGLRENGGFHLATKWYLRGWDPLPYQYIWHQCPIKNTTFLAGVGAGKTAVVAASLGLDCVTIPGFRALNASITAKQAELAFDMFDTWRDGNSRLDRFVKDYTLRPYPIIHFVNGSQFEFRTAGLGAKFIRGHEYDRINYDEGGLDEDGQAIKVLRGRLRGVRPDGSPRMARLDVTGTPSPAAWYRQRFEIGFPGSPEATPETLKDYFSMRVSTYDNTKLTAEQIHLMEAEYPPELIDIELKAMFPDYGMGMFPHNHIAACTHPEMNDDMYLATNPESGSPRPGWNYVEWPRVGIIKYEMPFDPNGIYVMAGDPGTDIPPKRNSAVICVANIAKNPMELVFFSWVPGYGSYRPFLTEYGNIMGKYAPVGKGVDTTGPQKAIDELGFTDMDLVIDPLNFNGLKSAMLNALSMDITGHNYKWPMIQGLQKQLNAYSDEMDRKGGAQDIVMTLAMLSHLSRMFKGVQKNERTSTGANYINRKHRTTSKAGRSR